MEDRDFEARCLAADAGMALEPAPERTVELVTVEIKALHKQAQQMALGYAIEIGRRLVEVKAMLPHGQWGDYLRDRLGYKSSTANNFMRIFEAYGAEQQSLFGPVAKSQALGNLSYTKALALLVLPDEERESFLSENDVDGMSTRELQTALKELAQAREDVQAAEAARKKTEAEIRLANERLSGMGREVESAREAQRTAEDQAEGYRLKLEEQRRKTEEAAASAGEEVSRLRAELEELRASPVDVAVEKVVDEDAVRAAAEQARAEAERELEERIRKAEAEKDRAREKAAKAKGALEALKQRQEKELEEARAARERAEEQLAQAKKQIQVASSGEVASFQVYFRQAQQMAEEMWEIIRSMRGNGQAETADKLARAMEALADKLREEPKPEDTHE